MWQCNDTAWLYVAHDTERAGSPIATICVPDPDTTMAERGIGPCRSNRSSKFAQRWKRQS